MYGLIVLSAVFVTSVPRDAGKGRAGKCRGDVDGLAPKSGTGPISVNCVASWFPATAAATPAKARSDTAAKRARCRIDLVRLVSWWAFEPVSGPYSQRPIFGGRPLGR